MLSALPVCLVSPLLGTALGAVEEFISLCGSRVTRGAVGGGGNRLSEFFPVQSKLAEASAMADAREGTVLAAATVSPRVRGVVQSAVDTPRHELMDLSAAVHL